MSSNGTITTVVHRDLDLISEGHKFEIITPRKRGESSQKMRRLTFAEIDICCRMHGILVYVVLRDLDLHFQKVKVLLIMHLLLKNCTGSGCPGKFVSTRTAPAVELLLFLTAWN